MHDDEEAGEGGEEKGKKRVECFTVGTDVENGERVVWVVEGGKYKASYLVGEEGVDEWESRCLISEVSEVFLHECLRGGGKGEEVVGGLIVVANR